MRIPYEDCDCDEGISWRDPKFPMAGYNICEKCQRGLTATHPDTDSIYEGMKDE